MAENIRLKISVEDLASAELKRVTSALKRLEGPVDELSFKFQYNFLRIQEAVSRFNANPMMSKVKSLATGVATAVSDMKSRWESWLDKTEKGRARFSHAVDSMKKGLAGLKNALTSMPSMIAGGAIGAAFGGAIAQGLKFNATMETMKVQFAVMTNDADRAGKIMRELVSFAAKTPFELEDVAGAARVMMAYGIEGSESLRRIGDAAAAANRPMDEIAMTFGRIKSGAFGEAFNRLAETGIATRSMLEGEGLVFDKGGSFVGSAEEAMQAVESIVDSRFSGMMDKMSQTMSGKMSTLKDDIAMTLGIVTGSLFDTLKPKLDELSAAFKQIREGGTAQGLGALLTGVVSPALDKALDLLKNPEVAFAQFVKIFDKVKLVFSTIGAGITWLWNVVPAFFTWLMAAIDLAALKIEKITLKPWDVSKKADVGKRIDVASDDVAFKKANLDFQSGKPGADETWSTGWAKILATDYVERVQELMKKGSESASMLLGKSGGGDPLASGKPKEAKRVDARRRWSGAGFDAETAALAVRLGGDWQPGAERRGLTAPFVSPLAVTPATRRMFGEPEPTSAVGPGGLSPMAADAMIKIGEPSAVDWTLAQRQANEAFREEETELFAEYYRGLSDLGTNLFVDSMSTIILSKHEDLKLALNDIWQGMKGNFVKMTVGMAAEWVKGKAKMLLSDHFFAKQKAAVDTLSTAGATANTAARVAGNTVEATSNLAVAKTGFFKAHSWIPWIGAGLAIGMIAMMMKSVGAFRTGGVVPGGGSGTEDDKTIRVSGGEGIITKRAVDANGGRSFVDAINSGRAAGGSAQTTFNFAISGGGEGLRLDIEREVVPVLERLVRQRRAVLS